MLLLYTTSINCLPLVNTVLNGINVFCFLSSLLLLPQPPRLCLTPTCHLSILTLYHMRACLFIWFEKFHWRRKEDERGPLSILYVIKSFSTNLSQKLQELYILFLEDRLGSPKQFGRHMRRNFGWVFFYQIKECQQIGWKVADIAVDEQNKAFAMVPISSGQQRYL